MKHKKQRSLKALSLLMLFMLIFSMSNSGVAFADTSGGGSDGGGGGGQSSGWNWRVAYYNGNVPKKGTTAYKNWTSPAWTQFAAKLGGRRLATTERHVRNLNGTGGQSGATTLDVCRHAQAIWWVAGGGVVKGRNSAWKYNGNDGSTKFFPRITKGGAKKAQSFTTAATVYGKTEGDKKFELLEKSASAWAGKNPDGEQLTLICSNNPVRSSGNCIFEDGEKNTCTSSVTAPKKTPSKTPSKPVTVNEPPNNPSNTVQERNWHEFRDRTVEKRASYNEPYFYNTEIKRHILDDDSGIDPIGVPNLHDQPMVSKKTNYGQTVDYLAKNPNIKIEQQQQMIANAIAKDKKEKHALVELDSNNRNGLAEGGILDIYEYMIPYKLDLYQKEYTSWTRSCSWHQYTNEDGNTYSYETCTPWVEYKAPDVHKNIATPKTQKNTGFWQILSVHCNEDGFTEITSGNGATIQTNGNPAKQISAVAYSKVYPEIPDTPDFGAEGEPSNQTGFYDKECPFNCTKTSTTQNATKVGTKPGASSGGTVDALNKNGQMPTGGKAVINDNKMTFFRDNEFRNVGLDIWKPVQSGIVGNIGEVLSTTIVRERQGTPGISSGENDNGGKFTALDGNNKPIFIADASEGAPTQINHFGDKSKNQPFSNEVASQISGEVDLLKLKATWASDKGYPIAMNIKWEYAPSVSIEFAASEIGFGVSSARNYGATTTLSKNVEGKCYAEFGKTNKTIDTKPLFMENTGTDSTNNLDDNLVQSYVDEFSGAANDVTTNLLVRFVRATTE